MSDARPRRGRGFAFGGFVLLVGTLLLLGGLDRLPEGFWFALAPMWPVLIIAPGLNLILSRTNVNLGSGVALLALGVAVAGAWIIAPTGWDTTTYVYSQSVPAEAVGHSRVSLELPAGEVNLFGGGDPTLAVDAEYSLRLPDTRVAMASRVSAAGQEIDIEFPLAGRDWDFDPDDLTDGPWEEWNLGLSPAVDTSVSFEGGLARLDMDLDTLRVKDLDIEVGVVDLDLALPIPSGRVDTTIQVGVGDLEIVIPDGVAARIRLRGGVTALEIDDSRFTLFSEYGDGFWIFGRDVEYRTRDYDTAANRIDVRVDIGVGEVNIR